MTDTLANTPLFAWHAQHGGRMVDFAGWSMPVQYTSIVQEHNATRQAAALFDVSHMGRLRLQGSGAEAFLDGLLTRRVAGMGPGKIRYSLVTRDDGGILDDVLVYHLQDADNGSYYQLVVNAGNREKIVGWIHDHLAGTTGVDFSDQTHETAMIAVQGPRALEISSPLLSLDPVQLRYFTGCEAQIAGHTGLVSRTGYTGEDGCELIVPAEAAMGVWEELLRQGESLGVVAAGLGARDTLRLEAAMPLYGHELSESIDPYQAGLDFAVDLKDRSFPGRDALVQFKDAPNLPRRVGLELTGKRAARQGYAIAAGDRRIGEVTSGSFSPTLAHPIAMGFVEPQFAAPDTVVNIDIRGRAEPARVVPLPFYRRKK